MRQVGYATGHFGKWHLGGGRDIGDAPLPSAYGFDESYTQWEGLGPRVLPTDLTNRLGQQSAELGPGPVAWLPRAAITHRFVDKPQIGRATWRERRCQDVMITGGAGTK